MSGEIKKVKIKDLPKTTSIGNDDIFVESDSLETYKVTADDIAKYISTNEHLTNKYVPLDSKGVANGVSPLNSNKKIDGKYITYGTTTNTAYEGSKGKVLEENFDNHLTDGDAHGYNTKINNEITRATNVENELSTNKLDKTTVAKSNELGLIKSGTDITVDTSGNVSVNDNSHKHTVSNISDLTATASELNVLDGITATTQELNYVDGVTSNIQTQLNSKSVNGHTHDDRYYTETEIDNKVADINSSITSHTGNTSNPHSVTKAQVGLGNVENKSSATIRGEITKSNVTTALGYTPLNQSLKGSASGLAELDSNGKVPSSQLPSFVDDVVEGYLSGGKFYKESAHTTEISGETGKIYIDLSTEKTYRWSGSAFVVISETLALGETSSTAYRGDRGKTAYDHSQSTHARTDATKVEKSSTNGNIKINGTETTVYTHPSGTNPHGTTKSDVGLGNVGNFKAVSTVASQGLTDTEKSNARANIGAGTSSFSGSYNDLTNKPTIPTNTNQLTNGAGYITSSGTAKTISDTLPISKGGTGKTTGVDAANVLIGSLGAGDTAPTDDTNIIVQGVGNYSDKFYRKPASLLWNYIKSKLATVATSGSYNDLSNKPTIPSGAAASKGVDTSISAASTSINLPTSKAVASFVEGKGYKTTDHNTTYSLTKSGSTITLTGSDGSTTSVTDSSGSSGSSVSFTRNLTSGTKVGTLTIDGTSTDLYAPTDTNTTYSAGTGISLSGTTFNHKNSVTAGTAQGDASKTLSFGGTFTVPTVTYDAQGHITGKGTTTMTMPANPNTDTKVIQTAVTASSYTNWRPLIIGSSNSSTEGFSPATVTDGTFSVNTITCQPSSGTIRATTFKGTLSGNASTATALTTSAGSATQPVYFSSGKPVACTYTLGKSVPSNAVFTDNDTKNTAGSTNTSSKIFLIGATSQGANPQTYSQDTAYVGTDGCLYSNSTRVVSEVISSTEPTNQKNGDYWLQDYE